MAGKHTVSDNERANAATLNPIFEGFHYRIADLEKAGSALKQARDEIVALGLERINEVVTPALQAIENVADLSDLFRARSETTVEIGTGVTEFIIVPEDRVQFAPPLFVSISVDGQLDKWVVGQVQSWTEATGQLFVNITHTRGDGTFADWVVSPANTPDTGPTLDAYSKAEVDAAILAAVAQAKSELLGGAPAAALDTIAELADALGNDADFAAWVTAQLAGKSATGHGHAIADVTGLQVALDDMASVTELASTDENQGASLIGFEDSAGNTDETNVQGAIEELYSLTGRGSIIIADDAVGEIPTPYTGGYVLISANTTPEFPQGNHMAIFNLDTGTSLALNTISIGVDASNTGSTVLTGTTGVDGKSSYSVKAGAIQIENRRGQVMTYYYQFVG